MFGTENSKTLSTLQNLANADGMLGKYAAAEAVLQESLEIQRRVTGPEHSDSLHAMVNLADALVFRRTQGPEHPRTLIVEVVM